MGAERFTSRVESLVGGVAHVGRIAIGGIEGVGHALEHRKNHIAQDLGTGVVDLVDPDVSILNPHNWGGDYRRH